MSASSKSNGTKVEQNTAIEAEVLYQKLGDRWFAFSVLDGDVFMSPCSEETIQAARSEKTTPKAA